MEEVTAHAQESTVVIVADTRENAAPVIEVLRVMPGVEVVTRSLKRGDYLVRGWIFERKTLPDLIESIIDGRLFSQAHRLVQAGAPTAIILEGKASDIAGTLMRREAIQGALTSLSIIYRIPVLRALDAAETARLLVYAAHQLRRHAADQIVRRGRRPKRRRRLQLHLLQGLPGIGLEKAIRLLDHFGSVEAVMRAGAADLEQVDGIGEKLAGSIRWILSDGIEAAGGGTGCGD
jgi:DNA excision repair protein ERCC-4